jgi:hypothetical protein
VESFWTDDHGAAGGGLEEWIASPDITNSSIAKDPGQSNKKAHHTQKSVYTLAAVTRGRH